jgi:hypothetical protein
MKILQVVQGFPPQQRAGTQIYTYYLSKELAKKHEVHVFYPFLISAIILFLYFLNYILYRALI